MARSDQQRWQARYGDAEPPGIDQIRLPRRFEAHHGVFPTAGRALELACGTGTAAVWLAARGLEVLAVDVSPAAIALAEDLARRARVDDRCRFATFDLDDGLPAGTPVDVILCNRFRDRRLDHAMVERLKPGGLLAIAVLSEVGAEPGRFRAPPGELLRAFSTFEVIDAGEADGEAWLLGRRR